MFINGVFYDIDGGDQDDGADDDQDDGSDDDGDDDQGSDDDKGKDGKDGKGDDKVTLTKAELDKRIKEATEATKKDRDKRWKDRMKRAGKAIDDDTTDADDDASKSKDKAKDKDTDAVNDRLDRADLRAEDIKEKAEQDIVIKYARAFKVDVVEALGTVAVKAELKAHRDKQSTPSPSKRRGTGASDDVEHWVRAYKKDFTTAPTREMRQKVMKRLREED